MKRNLQKRWNLLKKLWQPFVESRVSGHAAAASYYILLSLLPASVLGFAFLSLQPSLAAVWTRLLDALIPSRLKPVTTYFLSAIQPKRPASLLSFGAVVTLWSASKGIMALSDGFGEIFSQTRADGFITRRLRAMIVFLILFFVLSATVVLIIFSTWIYEQLNILLPQSAGLLKILFKMRYGLTFLLLALIFTVFYKLLLRNSLTINFCIKCGLITVAGWLISSILFSIYVNYSQSYKSMYGGIGLIFLGCIWLRLMMCLLLYSAIYVKLRQDEAYHPVAIIKSAFYH